MSRTLACCFRPRRFRRDCVEKAEIHVNGELVGVRIWSPYVFDLTDHLRPGEDNLQISVYNTLGPYLDAVSPTSFVFPGQTVSGLFGPVTLRETAGD